MRITPFQADAGSRPGRMAWRPVRWNQPRRQAEKDFYAAQTHRRIIKTHLPLDALLFSPKARYIGRRPRCARHGLERLQPEPAHAADPTPTMRTVPPAPYSTARAPGRPGHKKARAEHAQRPARKGSSDGSAQARGASTVRDYYLHFLEHDELPGFDFEPSVLGEMVDEGRQLAAEQPIEQALALGRQVVVASDQGFGSVRAPSRREVMALLAACAGPWWNAQPGGGHLPRCSPPHPLCGTGTADLPHGMHPPHRRLSLVTSPLTMSYSCSSVNKLRV